MKEWDKMILEINGWNREFYERVLNEHKEGFLVGDERASGNYSLPEDTEAASCLISILWRHN